MKCLGFKAVVKIEKLILLCSSVFRQITSNDYLFTTKLNSFIKIYSISSNSIDEMENYFNHCLIVSSVLTLGYIVVMYQYIKGWKMLPTWEVPPHYVPNTKVSIVIPARDEEKSILNCLSSIVQQNYPASLWEVIVVDDHSTDQTVALVSSFAHPNVKLLRLSDFVQEGETKAYKKKAIEVAIAASTGSLIVTTDADCVVQPNWLMLLVSYCECQQMKFVAAPVNFYQERNALERFQSLDFMGMMGIAGGGIQRGFMRMCNGANLAYTKAVFEEVHGFQNINHIASGDDMLLMHKVAARYPKQVGYLKNIAATVFTHAKPTLRDFLQQRIRWATKSSGYQEKMVTVILALVLFFCLNIVLIVLLIPLLGWKVVPILVGVLLAKAIMDYLFLGLMSRFFEREQLMNAFIPSFFMHIAYIVFVGTAANFVKNYEWKGRKVK